MTTPESEMLDWVIQHKAVAIQCPESKNWILNWELPEMGNTGWHADYIDCLKEAMGLPGVVDAAEPSATPDWYDNGMRVDLPRG